MSREHLIVEQSAFRITDYELELGIFDDSVVYFCEVLNLEVHAELGGKSVQIYGNIDFKDQEFQKFYTDVYPELLV